MGSDRQPPSDGVNTLAFGAGLALLFVAPLVRGGNRHVALMVLELLGLLVLLGLAMGLATKALPSWPVRLLALSPLAVALVQLSPVPIELWNALPGHGFYRDVLGAVGGAQYGSRPVSLMPEATMASVLAGIPIAALFLLAVMCNRKQLAHLLTLLIGAALLQAVLGLLQLSGAKWLYFDADFPGSVIGTFANRNHFANFLVMTLPLLVLRWSNARPDVQASRAKSRSLVSPGDQAGVLWAVALFALLAGVVASVSRTGLVTALLVTVMAVLLMGEKAQTELDRRQRLWRLGGVLTLLLIVLAAVGLQGLTRFADLAEVGQASYRWELTASTWQAAGEFWPLGSGLGSYAGVYPRFQPPVVRGFAEHAHNDYMQLLMECGLLFVALLLLLLWQLARAVNPLVRKLISARPLRPDEQVRLCCGIGLLALILHVWVDFNLRIPANAMVGALLLGCVLRHPIRSDPKTTKPR